MPFAFDSHVLPLLQEMASDPLADSYPILRRILELGLADDERQAGRLLDLIAADDFVVFRGKRLASGKWGLVYDVRLTPKGLAAVGIWPSDEDGGVYLLQRVGDALDAKADEMEADDADSDDVGRLRAGARSIRTASRELLVDVAARVISHKLDG